MTKAEAAAAEHERIQAEMAATAAKLNAYQARHNKAIEHTSSAHAAHPGHTDSATDFVLHWVSALSIPLFEAERIAGAS